jgi:hypothetical protein
MVVAQVNVSGWLQSNMYVFEDDQEKQNWNYYQGFQFRVSPQNNSNLYLNTFFRVAYLNQPADWEERFYNLYLSWKIKENYRLRLGRQFLYQGVINGTMDAAVISARVLKKLQFHGVIGMDATLDRSFELLKWEDGNVLGGYLSYRLPWQNSIEVSYFQKQRSDELYWQQIGSSFFGYLNQNVNYYVRFDYNLLSEKYQIFRGRLTYLQPKWSISAEYNSQRPRIYEDSFFSIFKVNAHNQIRAAFTYRLKNFDLGIQALQTVYNVSEFYILFKDDNDLRLIGSIGIPRYGNIGVILQNGFGGDNLGYFADLRYEFLPGLTARFYNSYYNYERATTNISQDALAFMGGLRYRLKNQILFDAELQQSSNNIYKNDVRLLARITYLFNN